MNTLNKTKTILNKYGIVANKRFGQNFLIDDNVLSNIIDVSDIQKEDLIIEIGPGLGNLTSYLLESNAFSLLIEVDKNMIKILEDRFSNKENYILINEDVLKLDLDKTVEEIEQKRKIKFKSVKVVANLPYYITTPIIFKLLQDSSRIQEIIVMVQKEVAQRMVANPKTKDYGILSVMTQYLSTASMEIIVPNSSFIPAPNVMSAVIKLVKEKKCKSNNEEVFFNLVHLAFAQRRKKMINSLESTGFMNIPKEKLREKVLQLGFNENIRAEEIKMEDFVKLSERLV